MARLHEGLIWSKVQTQARDLRIITSINHIIKSEFFIAYLATRNKIFIKKNIKGVFRGVDISP